MQFHNNKELVLIVDFGSQVTKLIARRIRDLGVYSEIVTPNELVKIKNFKPIKGIVLSGGPSTVTKKKFQSIPKKILTKKNTSAWYLLWSSTYCKTIRRKIKSSKKKKGVW